MQHLACELVLQDLLHKPASQPLHPPYGRTLFCPLLSCRLGFRLGMVYCSSKDEQKAIYKIYYISEFCKLHDVAHHNVCVVIKPRHCIKPPVLHLTEQQCTQSGSCILQVNILYRQLFNSYITIEVSTLQHLEAPLLPGGLCSPITYPGRVCSRSAVK